MCFDFHYKFSETFLIVRKIKRDIIINIRKFSREVPVIFVRFLFKLELSRQIFENFLIPNYMKIRPVKPRCSLRADGWTDTTKLTVAFRIFAIAPKK